MLAMDHLQVGRSRSLRDEISALSLFLGHAHSNDKIALNVFFNNGLMSVLEFASIKYILYIYFILTHFIPSGFFVAPRSVCNSVKNSLSYRNHKILETC